MEVKRKLIKEADLLKMIGQIMDKWKFIFVVAMCFSLFGLLIAVSTVKEYTAEIVVAPETSGPSGVSGLGALASMAGFNLSMGESGDAIYPLLYPDVISSLPFLTSLFDVRVANIDGTVDTTYYAYLKHYRKKTWIDDVKLFPIKAKNWLIGFFSSSPEGPESAVLDPYLLTKRQMNLVENLNSAIGIFVDKKTDVITLSFVDRDPRVAAAMVDTIMNRLQQEITQYRTKKAIDDCLYIERMYLEAKDSLDVSQQRYADFVSCNRNVINEYVIIEKERLVADKDLKTALHTQWAQQLQLARAKVQEKTPVFVTLKPAAVPAIPSSMGKMMKIMLYGFFGVVFAVAYVLLKAPIRSAWRKIRRKSEE